jgi:hypothetical protein
MGYQGESIVWTVARLFLMEILVSGFNFFVLMNRVYQPRWGELRAHQVGMTTRIVYLFVFAYLLVTQLGLHSVGGCLLVGGAWLLFILAFEWVGSLMLRRPVHEILIGWHVENGYMWPYVLATYLLSPMIVGLVVNR